MGRPKDYPFKRRKKNRRSYRRGRRGEGTRRRREEEQVEKRYGDCEGGNRWNDLVV